MRKLALENEKLSDAQGHTANRRQRQNEDPGLLMPDRVSSMIKCGLRYRAQQGLFQRRAATGMPHGQGSLPEEVQLELNPGEPRLTWLSPCHTSHPILQDTHTHNFHTSGPAPCSPLDKLISSHGEPRRGAWQLLPFLPFVFEVIYLKDLLAPRLPGWHGRFPWSSSLTSGEDVKLCITWKVPISHIGSGISRLAQ